MMTSSKKLVGVILFTFLIIGLGFPQEKNDEKSKPKEAEKASTGEGLHGLAEFGLREVTGDVYGRRDLHTGQCLGCGTPFDPRLSISKFNEYRDVRDGFYVPHLDLRSDGIFGSKYYA